jgi:hypothetical protein
MKPRNFLKELALVSLLCSGATIGAAEPLDVWHWRNPTPSGNRLYGVTYGDGRYVAAGEMGTVISSSNTHEWEQHSAPVRADLRSVAHGAGRFVAVGDGGVIVVSDDGRTWQGVGSATFVDLHSVAWGNGVFVAVGKFGAVLSSSDGTAWTLRSVGGEDLSAVAFGAGEFIAVGGANVASPTWPYSVPRPLMLASRDGVFWQRRYPDVSRPFSGICWKNGRWLGVTIYGETCLSLDGHHWTVSALEPHAYQGLDYRVAAHADQFVVMGGKGTWILGGFWRSDDGLLWEYVNFEHPGNAPSAIAAGHAGVVAVGGAFPWRPPSIQVSTNLSDWELRPIHERDMAGWATHTGGLFMVGGARRFDAPDGWYSFKAVGTECWVSSEGLAWKRITLSPLARLRQPVFGGHQYVTVGSAGQAAYSSDGLAWSDVATGITNDLNHLVYDGTRFVAAGEQGSITWSSDGLVWHPVSIPATNAIVGLAWNQKLVAVEAAPENPLPGEAGRALVWVSDDLQNWSRHELPEGLVIWQLVPWREGFAGVASSGRVAVSSDGINWQENGPIPLYSIPGILAVVQDRLVYGQQQQAETLLSSVDGLEWRSHPLPWRTRAYQAGMTGLAAGAGTLLVVNSKGHVLQSEPLTPTKPELTGPPLIVRGRPGRAAVMRIEPYGTAPFSYQWRRNGSDIVDATNQFLALPASEPPGNHYSVLVSNQYGQVESASSVLVEPMVPELSVSFDGLFSLRLRGDTGRWYVLEWADQFSATSPNLNWRAHAFVPVDVGTDADVNPWVSSHTGQAYFRVRLVE